MENFKASENHKDELSEYAITAYISCIGDMIKLMIEKGIEEAILVMTKVKNSYGCHASSS